MSHLPSRVGIIGDVHAEHRLLEGVLRHFEALGIQAALCAGDIVDGAGDAEACIELLQRYEVVTVRGNHDRWFAEGSLRGSPDATPLETVSAEGSNYLAQLPVELALGTPIGRLLLCHGIGSDDMNRVGPDDYGYGIEVNEPLQEQIRSGETRLLVNGHTHRRMVRHFGGLTIVNAGTLRADHDPCCGMLDFQTETVTFWDLDVDGNTRQPEAHSLRNR
jgi:predicted phosphodiesterase